MNTEIFCEAIPKTSFTFSTVKSLVYNLLGELSTPSHPLELADTKCTLRWTKPPGVQVKNADRYFYLLIEIESEAIG